MRKLFILIAFLSFINCDKNPLSHKEKFFEPQKLPLLSLEKVNNFWQDDSIKHTSNYIDGSFNNHSNFLVGISYRGDIKGVGISVFKSQTDAIEAMKLRRNNVAAIIEPGNSSEIFKGKWWYTDNIPNAVFVNQWNTITEVSYYHLNYEEVRTSLMETAIEIARRIDSLSN
jgi:hypothetical protein